MANWNTKELKAAAADRLQTHGAAARRLTLIYTLALALLSVGSNALNLLLHSQISGTGGLGGLGLRSVLQTLQEILSYINMFFGPFWAAGFLYAMLLILRDRSPRERDLNEGFRRFGRIVGGFCFEYLAIMALTLVVANVTAVLISFTDWMPDLIPLLEAELAQNPDFFSTDAFYVSETLMLEVLLEMAPMLILMLLLLLPGYTFLSYSFRMALYLMMEREISGSRAYILSWRMMRRHRWKIFKLDLSFWWYYLLANLISAVSYLDTILTVAGVELPFGEIFWFFATMVLSWGLLLGLNLWKKPSVECTYLAAFEVIAHPPQEPQIPEQPEAR